MQWLTGGTVSLSEKCLSWTIKCFSLTFFRDNNKIMLLRLFCCPFCPRLNWIPRALVVIKQTAFKPTVTLAAYQKRLLYQRAKTDHVFPFVESFFVMVKDRPNWVKASGLHWQKRSEQTTQKPPPSTDLSRHGPVTLIQQVWHTTSLTFSQMSQQGTLTRYSDVKCRHEHVSGSCGQIALSSQILIVGMVNRPCLKNWMREDFIGCEIGFRNHEGDEWWAHCINLSTIYQQTKLDRT